MPDLRLEVVESDTVANNERAEKKHKTDPIPKLVIVPMGVWLGKVISNN